MQVSNSTGQAGLATTATDQLKRNGFNVMAPDDYPSSLLATTVFFRPATNRLPPPWPPCSASQRSSG